ncbi:MAG: 4Fe-4S dicluster domain-containing protein [Prevotellaceae bacterium]|jgi:polyferredoxin|nr:4Fe-4S dicluster domain-containing protein [Prevotellaceae bacterium]
MLRNIRITLAVIFLTLTTLLFLDVTGTLHTWLGWLAKIQFMPALLGVSAFTPLFLLLLTLLLGRVYCSVICPLGVMQDIIAWLGRRGKKRNRFKYSYSKEKWWLRLPIFVLYVFVGMSALAGAGTLLALLDPYGAYGRIVSSLMAPVYQAGNNLLAYLAARADSYMFYSVEVWLPSLSTLLIAVVTLATVVVLSWRNGRTYCNTICPVGTLLGMFSRFSLFKIKIDTDKCTSCQLCARSCKAACIDIKQHKVDYSRCVTCMDCLGQCREGALSFSLPRRKKAVEAKVVEPASPQANDSDGVDTSRRAFFTAGALLATGTLLKAQEKKRDGGFAVIEDKVAPPRTTPIHPAGSHDLRRFARHCTGCQLCVAACPSRVLRPSSDLMTLMQPVMAYDHGYCRPECTRCSEVCPADAISLISAADKSSTQIGHAVWVRKNCVPLTDGKACGNCARHCPASAITMIPSVEGDPGSIQIPAVDTERCIGCGACEYLCPSRPFTAIYVEGHEAHKLI